MSMTIDKRIRYENHLGEVVVLGEGAFHFGQTDLFDTSWAYTTSGTAIAAHELEASERALPVTVSGGTLADRERVYKVLEADAACGELGTLSFGAWSVPAVATAQALDHWWFDDGVEEREVTFLLPRPLWCREVVEEYPIIESGSDLAIPGSDYPKPHPYGYGRGSIARMATVPTLGDAEWLLRVYGPAVDPYVIVEGNRHQVLVTVPAGSRLELDTRERTVTLISSTGERENVLDKRLRGALGSGTYAFKQLPRGRVAFTTNNSFAFDAVIYDERTSPSWK